MTCPGTYPTVLNGYVSYNDSSTAEFACLTGFYMTGTKRITCTSGVWQTEPTCNVIDQADDVFPDWWLYVAASVLSILVLACLTCVICYFCCGRVHETAVQPGFVHTYSYGCCGRENGCCSRSGTCCRREGGCCSCQQGCGGCTSGAGCCLTGCLMGGKGGCCCCCRSNGKGARGKGQKGAGAWRKTGKGGGGGGGGGLETDGGGDVHVVTVPPAASNAVASSPPKGHTTTIVRQSKPAEKKMSPPPSYDGSNSGHYVYVTANDNDKTQQHVYVAEHHTTPRTKHRHSYAGPTAHGAHYHSHDPAYVVHHVPAHVPENHAHSANSAPMVVTHHGDAEPRSYWEPTGPPRGAGGGAWVFVKDSLTNNRLKDSEAVELEVLETRSDGDVAKKAPPSKPKKPAKEVRGWLPHSHTVRNNNTSTK